LQAGYGAKRLAWDGLHSIRVAIPVAALLALPVPAYPAPDIELGRYLATQCMTCHRGATSAGAAIPNIFGVAEPRLIALIKSYRDKQLPNTVMQGVAAGLNDGDIEAVAAYFARTKRP
jgi:cytochrome c